MQKLYPARWRPLIFTSLPVVYRCRIFVFSPQNIYQWLLNSLNSRGSVDGCILFFPNPHGRGSSSRCRITAVASRSCRARRHSSTGSSIFLYCVADPGVCALQILVCVHCLDDDRSTLTAVVDENQSVHVTNDHEQRAFRLSERLQSNSLGVTFDYSRTAD